MKTIITVAALGIFSLFGGIFKIKNHILIFILLAGLALGLVFNFMDWNTSIHYFNNMIGYDNYSIFFSSIMIISTIFIFTLCLSYYSDEIQHLSDIYGLLFFTLVGGIIMIAAFNFVMLFVGLEILSISLYILTGSNRKNMLSNEASLKYFLTGSLASGIILFGIALVYGATNSFDFIQIAKTASSNTETSSLLTIGYILISVGFLFKISAAPFHSWTPDVYEGAPTTITMFMATIVKTAAIATFMRFLSIIYVSETFSFTYEWKIVFSIVAAVTLLIGNITALYQTNLKRLLAYSSISHVGYLLMGLTHINQGVVPSWIGYYIAGYSVATIAVFAILIIIKENIQSDSLQDLKGLAKKNPFIGFILSFALLSLAGIPPLAGFMGKYYMFIEALKEGYFWLVGIAIITSVISIYYYVRIINIIYKDEEFTSSLKITKPYYVVLTITSIVILMIGIFPQWITRIL